jgi:hypothetical protein
MTINICPKCRYQRQSIDHNIHPDLCPGCGIVYSKFMAKYTHETLPDKTLPDETEAETNVQIETEEILTLPVHSGREWPFSSHLLFGAVTLLRLELIGKHLAAPSCTISIYLFTNSAMFYLCRSVIL